METYVVRRLEQARLLSDPFKLKLLEQFAAGPATTKQVADLLGEKAPRLYRHVDALVHDAHIATSGRVVPHEPSGQLLVVRHDQAEAVRSH